MWRSAATGTSGRVVRAITRARRRRRNLIRQREHNAYIDCYWVNTVVRVRPDRTIETLATVEQGLDFPADNAFDERWGEKKTLIWNNGGWNFNKPSVDAIDVGRRRAWVP
jgi:hypothetical protein